MHVRCGQIGADSGTVLRELLASSGKRAAMCGLDGGMGVSAVWFSSAQAANQIAGGFVRKLPEVPVGGIRWVERVAYTSVKGEGVLVLSFNDHGHDRGFLRYPPPQISIVPLSQTIGVQKLGRIQISAKPFSARRWLLTWSGKVGRLKSERPTQSVYFRTWLLAVSCPQPRVFVRC